jgi:hypothetical protein
MTDRRFFPGAPRWDTAFILRGIVARVSMAVQRFKRPDGRKGRGEA